MSSIETQRTRRRDGPPGEPLAIAVGGMTCEGCATTLKTGLLSVDGVREVRVDVDAQQVTLWTDARLDDDRVRRRIEQLGFTATEGPAASRTTRLVELAALALVVGLLGALLSTVVSDDLGAGWLSGVTDSFRDGSLIAIAFGFLFGVLVAFSPATLAVAPVVMGYVTCTRASSPGRAVRLAAAFVAGIVLIDVILGAAFGAAGTSAIAFISSRLAFGTSSPR